MTDDTTQQWDPDHYAATAGFVSELGGAVVEWLAPAAGERVLDLGCGEGTLAVTLQQKGCVVVGVDASAEMVAGARRRGVDARTVNGHELTFDREFDAVFSNAALHWMTRPSAVISGVWSALKPGGRFAGEFGGAGNVGAIVSALTTALRGRHQTVADPWFFPDPPTYRRLLERSGFIVDRIELIDRPTPLAGDVGDWIRTFAQPYLQPIAPVERPAFLAGVVESLRDRLCDRDGLWWADYVRLRFAARKPDAAP